MVYNGIKKDFRSINVMQESTDGFTPELKTNEEQKQACCCVDYFLLTSISLLKKIFKVYIF